MKKLFYLMILTLAASLAFGEDIMSEESFENSFPPSGWVPYAVSGDTWAKESYEAHTGTYSAWQYEWSGGENSWLITPGIDISSYSNQQLVYWEYVGGVTSADQHNVKISTNYSGSGDPTNANWDILRSTIGGSSWNQISVDISNYTGTVYIAFQYYAEWGGAEWNVDDVKITGDIPPPTATTDSASNITSADGTLNGTVNGGGVSTDVTFEYGTDTAYGTSVAADQSPVTGSSDTPVTKTLTGLDPYTEYHYRVVAINGGGTVYGADETFTTLGTEPDITTLAVDNISHYSAAGNGHITDLGAPEPTAHGVCWNTTGAPTLTDSYTDEGAAAATGDFTSEMTGLIKGTQYFVRAYATNTAGTAYGDEVNFYTMYDPPADVIISLSGNDIVLDWTSTANTYYIYRSDDPYGGYVQIGSSTATSYTDIGAASENKKYFYYITAE